MSPTTSATTTSATTALSTSTTGNPRVAVVGGGPGGLLCAHVLRRRGIDVTVFERERSEIARDQGGTLDLHPDSGQAALATAGLTAAFAAHARPEGQEVRQYDARGTLVEHTEPDADDTSRPEIDRHDLRAILLTALGSDAVHWGSPVTAVTPLPDGRARLEFDGRPGEDFDLVVGADGAWSRIRPAVSDARPRYTGNALVEAWFTDVDRRHPAIAELVGHGTMAAFDPTDDTTVIIAQRNSDGRVRVYVGLRAPEHWTEDIGIDPADPDAIAVHLLTCVTDWDASLRALITDHHSGFVNRPIHMLPIGHRWPHRPGITLLGDAAHLMPPAGEGANLALIDGADLAIAVLTAVTTGTDLDVAVRDYEHHMQQRAAAAATRAAAALGIDDESEPTAGQT